jgi:hypothetical protein
MFRTQRQKWSAGWAAGALLALALLPGLAPAQNGAVTLRNDTQITVVVSVSSVAGGRILRAKPQLVKPGLSVPFVLPGNKAITLYDAHAPTRALYSGIIPASPLNLSYSIQPDTPPLLKLAPLP